MKRIAKMIVSFAVLVTTLFGMATYETAEGYLLPAVNFILYQISFFSSPLD